MASQKEVKNRIASVKNINKITRAMEMVAAARLRRAEQRISDMRPYAEGMRKLTRRAAAQAGGIPRVPVLEERENVNRVGIVLVTGDRGLAGAFNSNIIREGMRMAAKVRDIGEALTARYVDQDLDRVELIYNRFVSPLTQHVWRQTLLPLQQAEVIGEGAGEEAAADEEETAAEKAQSRTEWVYEPDPEELLARLIPEYVTISVYRALLESAASELGARMTAMRNAAENAESIMDELTLEMNRERQSEITQEILEVVAGAEALG